jgi:ABC-2 type transport system permease protein
VSLVWAVVATALAYRLFLRRDFTDLTDDRSGRRLVVGGLVPLAGLLVLTVAAVGVATPATGSGITRGKLEDSLATAYAHLYRLQTEQLHRPAVTETELDTRAQCAKGGDPVVDRGPGTDWRCVVSWRLPGSSAEGSAIYQLDVTADGRYVADGDGPKEVNGYFQVRSPIGDAPNPLWQLDGNLDLL